MKKLTIAILLSIVVCACHHSHHHDKDAHKESNAMEVIFHDEHKPAEWSICKVEKKDIGCVVSAMSQVLSSPEEEDRIVALYSGKIKFLNKDIALGKRVSKGQALFAIENNEIADNSISVRYQQAKADYQASKIEYERKKELLNDGIVSQAVVDKALQEYTSAKALYNALSSASQGTSNLRSNRNGYIVSLKVGNGEYVQEGDVLAIVSENKTVNLKCSVPYSYYNELKNLKDANFILGDKVISLSEKNGKILSYSHTISEQNGMVDVILQIRNDEDFLTGSFIKTFLITDSQNESLVIDKECVMEELGVYFVFVQKKAEVYEKRQIKVGKSDGKHIEILSGLKEEEKVVAKGAYLLRLAQSSGTLDAHAGHNH